MVPIRVWHKDNLESMDNRIKKFEEEIKKIDKIVSIGTYDGMVEARRKALEYAPTIGFRDGLVKQIDEEEAAALKVFPSSEKIREVVWNCESTKAPCSDGYNMNFIKKCWDEIGQEFTTAVLEFFQSAKLPTDANVTWVALAPKFVEAKKIKDLQMISMVDCVYKVISKLLLKLRKKKVTIIKLDFQKAYDSVRWSFVNIVLQKMDFGLRWRTWVKECVTTVSMLVLINGPLSKPFKMERGLRQRDILSHFLFVLVVDVLHRMKWVINMCGLLGCTEVALPVRYLEISLGVNLILGW
ncbi:uncharacterized protein LOC107632859 [Arachis ipaensis]|uniref:uncharacterized protein LOC107632859 n=1 Tax=Arachis ipaensis TaxID=130454 RepID=UPI0007AF44B1|nr:uncharacterized protein LOC107632859 [Arachis ipaensis]